MSDVFPLLEWLDIGGHVKDMKTTAREILDAILESWMEEHRRRKKLLLASSSSLESNYDDGGKQDFMDVMLSVLDGKEDLAGYDVNTIIKATSLSMISGGTDTTWVTLTWAISLLLNNFHSLKKVEEELNSHIGYERMVNESDVKELVYLDAVIKETLRVKPPVPPLPRECIEDCIVAGNFVPKGTRLIVNLWKIQTDSQIWSDPLMFRPERFLDSTCRDIDVKGNDFELIPFGSGRRICPGTSFALNIAHLALASFLHAFEISNPCGEPVDIYD